MQRKAVAPSSAVSVATPSRIPEENGTVYFIYSELSGGAGFTLFEVEI